MDTLTVFLIFNPVIAPLHDIVPAVHSAKK